MENKRTRMFEWKEGLMKRYSNFANVIVIRKAEIAIFFVVFILGIFVVPCYGEGLSCFEWLMLVEITSLSYQERMRFIATTIMSVFVFLSIFKFVVLPFSLLYVMITREPMAQVEKIKRHIVFHLFSLFCLFFIVFL